MHKVLGGQTLFSISRTYGVTVQDIAAANPAIKLEVISEGQVLKIPEISTLDEFSESYYGLTKDDFIYHTVKSQQTVNYLSKKYNVAKKEIYSYNPGSEEVIQIGQVIKIPKAHIIQSSGDMPNIDTTHIYTVKQGDTLYSLSKKFGVSVADLILINPQLRWGLKTGMVLNLSGERQISPFAHTDTLDIRSITSFRYHSDIICDSIRNNRNPQPIKVVMLLPFHARELLALDTITNDSARKANENYKYLNRGINFTEFYEGFLIAVDSIQKLGAQVTLFTYDTKSDTMQIEQILKELEIIRPDLIFGPILPENIKHVSVYAQTNSIPIVLPLSSHKNKATNGNPYAITLIPDIDTELNYCADYLSQFHDKNIILIHNEDSLGSLKIDEFRETLFAYFSSKSTYEEVLYKEIRLNDTSEKNLAHTLRENIDNVVFIVSSNEAYVSNIIGLLRINQSLGYNIQAFGLPVWRSFDNLRIELLHQLNTVIYVPFFIDYTSKKTQKFLTQARSKLGHEPYRKVKNGKGYNYTYLGYESGLMFLSLWHSYGKDLRNCLCYMDGEMPQTTYRLKWDANGGFSNVSINFVNYTTDYDVKLIEYESLQYINSQPKLLDDVEMNPFILE